MIAFRELLIKVIDESIDQDIEDIAQHSTKLLAPEVEQVKARFLAGWPKQWPPAESYSPKTNWITYTLDQIKELGEKYNPARNFVSQSAMRGSGQDDTQRQIDLEKEFWVLIAWEPTDDPPYFKLQCCNKPYPTTAPRIQLQYNGVPITVPISPSYDAEEGLLDVEITQALPANENMQLRMAPNNKDSTELVIDVCSIA